MDKGTKAVVNGLIGLEGIKIPTTATVPAVKAKKRRVVKAPEKNIFTFCYAGHAPIKSRTIDNEVVSLANGATKALSNGQIASLCFKDNRTKAVIPEYVNALSGMIKFFAAKKRAVGYRLTLGAAYKNLIGIAYANSGTNANIFLGIQDGFLYGKPLCSQGHLSIDPKAWLKDYGVKVTYHTGHKYLDFWASAANVKAILKALPKLFK